MTDAGRTHAQPPPARGSSVWVRRLALANLVANAGIIATGAAVRLTGSGLGCTVWPRCTPDSLTPTPKLGINGKIEFTNRTLTIVLGVIIAALIVSAWRERPRRRSVVRLAIPQSLAILGQAVLGGITVRTGLNPWTVAAHLLLSVAIVYAAYALWVRTGEGDGPRVFAVARPLVWLARTLTAATAAVIVAGTVVTGSGPHSGAKAASRTGLDLGAVTQLHADLVFLLLGLTVAAWLAFRAAGYGERPVLVLLGVELAQGVLGFVQYALKLPIVAVELHVIGATILWIAALAVLFGVRTRA